MIDASILNQVRCGVCAIGYVTVNMPEYIKDLSRPFFKVFGTGFLVRDTTVITNRHVIEEIRKAQREMGFSDGQIRCHFVYPLEADEMRLGFCVLEYCATLQDLDIALVTIRAPEGEMGPCRPLPVGLPSSLAATQPIAVCGYPYGTEMMARGGKIYRFGPVVQQGYVSALAPYDASSRVQEILLDVRAAPGMSGSPVFNPEDGSVIGVLYAGWEATTSAAIPVDETSVGKWLDSFDQLKHEATQKPATEITQVGSGDSPPVRLVLEEAISPQGSGNGEPSGMR